jgi:prolyl oligopeptidase
MKIDRRTLLGSTAALVGVWALPKRAWADGYVTPVDVVLGSGPPVAPVRPVTEDMYGTKVTDRYRWMESEDAEWQTYVRAEGDYTTKVLALIPGRDQLAAEIETYTGEIVIVVSVQTGGTKIFTEVRPAGANTSKLFVRDGMEGTDKKLIDPDKFATAGSHASLDWWQSSPDGTHVVFGASPGGSEQSVAHVVVTETGALLPEAIDRTADASPSWLPDGSGFFYNRLQAGVSPDSTAYEEKSVCWFHKLGTDPAADIKVLGEGTAANVPVQDIDFPNVFAVPGSDLATGLLVSGVQNELAIYIASAKDAAAGNPVWKQVCSPAAKVTNISIRGEKIYLLSHDHASRYKILQASAETPQASDAAVVVPQSDSVIVTFAGARDALYILDLDAGLSGLRRLGDDGKVSTIKLPFEGSIDDASFYADTLHDGVWFLLESWVKPTVVCYCGPDGVVHVTDISPQPPIDVSPYTSEEVFATAHDGVKIPLSIIYKKGVKRDGSAPMLLEAYGAYGIKLNPVFISRWLPWLDLGGVFAVGHVRGGGELGEDWHLAGQKLTKPNTWRDTIACAEYLIAQNYTSKRTLAVIGGSAGGITVGRFMTERPDLAAVVIDQVGVSDALRSEFSPNGPPNIPEFGTVTNEVGFKGLYAMDAYQHVKDGVKYPAVLLSTGLHDPRVSSWEPTKMTARLQAATASKNPVLLRVEADAGHGIGSTRAQRDKETADVMAFILWRTGNPAYQPSGAQK